MTAETTRRFARAERLALVLALAAAVAVAILGWHRPAGLVPAWRLAAFACLQPALGSLLFVLVYRLTGGQWMQGIGPFLHAGARLLPWIWLVIVPLLWVSPGPGALGSLAETFGHDGRTIDPSLRVYFAPGWMAARTIFYAVAFFLLSIGAARTLRDPARQTMRWFGPLGLIGVIFMLHLLSTDWILLLDPGWYSTGFPLVWAAAQALSGLAVAVCAALWAGAEPARRGPTKQPFGIDWGNLLLASVMSWTYVAFVQLLIIWSGNLPSETAWYVHRMHGGWKILAMCLGALEFFTPFLLLLSRGIKRGRATLAGVAALLALGQLAYTIWIIAPAFPRLGRSAPALDAALLVAAGALFLNRYLAGARRIAALSS